MMLIFCCLFFVRLSDRLVYKVENILNIHLYDEEKVSAVYIK